MFKTLLTESSMYSREQQSWNFAEMDGRRRVRTCVGGSPAFFFLRNCSTPQGGRSSNLHHQVAQTWEWRGKTLRTELDRLPREIRQKSWSAWDSVPQAGSYRGWLSRERRDNRICGAKDLESSDSGDPILQTRNPSRFLCKNLLRRMHTLFSNNANVTAAHSTLVPPPFRAVDATAASSALQLCNLTRSGSYFLCFWLRQIHVTRLPWASMEVVLH